LVSRRVPELPGGLRNTISGDGIQVLSQSKIEVINNTIAWPPEDEVESSGWESGREAAAVVYRSMRVATQSTTRWANFAALAASAPVAGSSGPGYLASTAYSVSSAESSTSSGMSKLLCARLFRSYPIS